LVGHDPLTHHANWGRNPATSIAQIVASSWPRWPASVQRALEAYVARLIPESRIEFVRTFSRGVGGQLHQAAALRLGPHLGIGHQCGAKAAAAPAARHADALDLGAPRRLERQTVEERQLVAGDDRALLFAHDDQVYRVLGHAVEHGEVGREVVAFAPGAQRIVAQHRHDGRDILALRLAKADHSRAAATKAAIRAPSLTPGALSTPELTSTWRASVRRI